MSDDLKPFVCSYPYGDSRWGLEIHARDFEDAKRRLERIGSHGVVDGELVMTIPVVPGAGLYVRAITAIRNWLRGLR